jgi:hypothetical protein
MKRLFFFMLTAFLMVISVFFPTGVRADVQEKYVDISEFGAKADDAIDDSQAIMDAIRAVDNAGGGIVHIPGGTYQLTSVNVAVTHPISIIGEPGTVLDGKQSTKQYLFNIEGTREESAPLLVDAAKNEKTIQAVLSVKPGDVVLFHSDDLFNPARNYYYRGEMAEVESVSGNKITFKQGLFDSYRSSSTVIYKLNMPKIRITGLKIIRDSNHAGLTINYAKDLHLSNIEVSGARERGIGVSYIYGGTIENIEISDCWYEGSGTSYGLSIASSQHLTVQDSWLHGGRHGISLGGWEPARDILITKNIIDNYTDSRVGAFNTHENIEYITVSENRILNGVSTAGDHLVYEDNKIELRTDCPGIIVKQNWNSEQLVFRNNQITSPSYGILLETYLPSLEVKELIVEGNTIRSDSAGIGIKPRLKTAKNTKIKNIIIRNNDIESTKDSTISIPPQEGTTIVVENMEIDGGTYQSLYNKGIFSQVSPSSGSVTIFNAKISTGKAAEFGMLLINFSQITIDGSNLQGSANLGSYNYFQHANSVIVRNSTLGNWNYKNGVRAYNVPRVQLENNTYINTPS